MFLQTSRDCLLAAHQRGFRIFGVDADLEAVKAGRRALREKRVAGSTTVIHSDFFSLATGSRLPPIDAVVGNPPYVRYQLIDSDVRARALSRAVKAGVRLTQLSSLWAPFVIHAASLLSAQGRLALVLPAELLHAQYARPVRRFLLEYFESVVVITFEQRIFPGALTEVVLLLAERGSSRARGVHVVTAQGLEGLPPADEVVSLAVLRKTQDRDWSSLLAPEEATSFLDELVASRVFAPLGAVAEVDVGSVTGDNDFFTVTKNEAVAAGLPAEFLVPVVMKARDVAGARYTKADHETAVDSGRKASLIVISDRLDEADLPPNLRRYLAKGKRLGVHEGYKCRVRRRWYGVPATGVPTAFLTYMASDIPRLVLNDGRSWSTNTVHGVVGDLDTLRWLAASFVNTVTLLSAELFGRSYGGGVLKLEPTEAERVLVPTMRLDSREVQRRLDRADTLLRTGRADELRRENDGLLWGKSRDRLMLLEQLYQRLRSRRQSREAAPSGVLPGVGAAVP
jgi:adenine-specific DNA methylase